MLEVLKRVLRGESGQSFMEYGLIATLVVLAAVAAYKSLGERLSTKIETVNSNLD